MKRDELIQFFSKPVYGHVREDIYRIMLERPDISDPDRIENAAEQMHESRGDGVELTVENALRLTGNYETFEARPTADEIEAPGAKSTGDLMDVIFNAELEDYSECKPSNEANRKFRALNACADALAKNDDIVITGRPEFFCGADWAQLTLAVFSPSLTKDEQQIIQDMTHWCDESKVFDKNGYLKLCFYIKNIWAE